MSKKAKDRMDELVRRAYDGAAGAPANFAGGVRRRMAGNVAARPSGSGHTGWLVAAAAAAGITIVLGLAFALSSGSSSVRLPDSSPEGAAPTRAEVENARPDKAVEDPGDTRPRTPTGDADKLEPSAVVEDDDPTVVPEPRELPSPEDNPPPRDDRVERDPSETPKAPPTPDAPGDDDPGDTIKEDPQPADPDKGRTGAKEKDLPLLGTVTTAGRKARLKVRYGAGEWRDAAAGEELKADVELSCNAPVYLSMGGGAIFRFEGNLILGGEPLDCTVELLDDYLYIDTLSTGLKLTVTCHDLTAETSDAVVLFKESSSALEIACIYGEVKAGGKTLVGGKVAKLKKRGLSKPAPFRGDRILKALPERVILREDFTEDPGDKLYKGTHDSENGLAVNRTGLRISLEHIPSLKVLPDMVLRFRLKARSVKLLEMTIGVEGYEKSFELVTPIRADDKWKVFEFRLSKAQNKANRSQGIEPGMLLTKISFFADPPRGPNQDRIEIDWIEYVRAPK